MEPQEEKAPSRPELGGKSRPGLSEEQKELALSLLRTLVRNAVRQSMSSVEGK